MKELCPFFLSVVCPVYNEEGLISIFLRELTDSLDILSLSIINKYEIILIDDGSTDNSFQIIQDIAILNPQIKCLSLSRNFGHQKAINCGLVYAQGDAVVMMDSDFQDHPQDLKKLLDKYLEGYDVVYAIRTKRKEDLRLRFMYFLYYRFLNLISYQEMPLDAGDFSIFSKKICRFIADSPESYKYIRGLRAWVGFKQTGILLERHSRYSGKSKYSLLKLILLASSGLCSFSLLPLRLASLLGLGLIALSSCFLLYTIFIKFFLGSTPIGYTSLIFLIVTVFGVNLLILGIIGEYIGRIYEEVKRRPQFIVSHSINIKVDEEKLC